MRAREQRGAQTTAFTDAFAAKELQPKLHGGRLPTERKLCVWHLSSAHYAKRLQMDRPLEPHLRKGSGPLTDAKKVHGVMAEPRGLSVASCLE